MKASIDDVARESGVSKSTVSRALSRPDMVSDATCAKVLAAAERLNFSVSRASGILKSGRSQRIAMLVGSNQIDWFSAKIIEGLNPTFQQAGYDLVVYPVAGQEERATFFDKLPVRGNADAVVVSSFDISPAEIKRLGTAHVPIVGINVASTDEFTASASIDDDAGIRLAVKHLAQQGHRNIVYVQPQVVSTLHFSSYRRITGFTATCAQLGLLGRTVTVPASQGEDDTHVFDAVISDILAADDRPTALCFHQDSMAIPFFFRLGQCGLRIPDDISIVGYDDSTFAAEVGLTTIRQDPRAMAEHVARATLRLIDGGTLSTPHERFAPQLIVRSSTAPAA
ncbi:LacI family DNA-binding transcriptional regulator [Bifidobacterium oedipodis]|uniref:LacI family transcriptional regulator n=1 Tax=Bifidobacterium oedipodis TaxID=2675322 RepID=A0A7Y0ET94_9BIFI|nr:LacI family DNA-binding transcriptional regulator [Bifidobacterium sp. DSM 109957]NMM94961.1 LacI family transcriptional regulator [Bifidobacterium sp. DSM 109957]